MQTADDAREREQRFVDLVERQSRFVFQVVYTLLRHTQDSEDVVQDVFFKLYRTGAWERMENEKAFLARSAWRLACPRLRRNDSEVLDVESVSMDADPEEAAIALDQAQAVRRLIEALPEELRQPLVLSASGELSSREIAEVMGIPEGTVRTRLMRAREILKRKLAGRRLDDR